MARKIKIEDAEIKLDIVNEKISNLQKEKAELEGVIEKERFTAKAKEYDKMNVIFAEQLGINFKECGELLIKAIEEKDFSKLQEHLKK